MEQVLEGLLFLKKKKQKDFYPFARTRLSSIPARRVVAAGHKSLLVLFFRKEHSCFFLIR
jgi:hypothetical protein